MIMEMLPFVSLEKAWPPLISPPVAQGWCKLCGDRPVISDEHCVIVQFGGGWRFTYRVCETCFQAASEKEDEEDESTEISR